MLISREDLLKVTSFYPENLVLLGASFAKLVTSSNYKAPLKSSDLPKLPLLEFNVNTS